MNTAGFILAVLAAGFLAWVGGCDSLGRAGGECEDGSTRCDGDMVQECSASMWNDYDDCGSRGKRHLLVQGLAHCWSSGYADADVDAGANTGSDTDTVADTNPDIDSDTDGSRNADIDAVPDFDTDADAGSGAAWVVVAPGGRYLMTTDGKPFVPIGNQPEEGFYDSWPDWKAALEAHLQRMVASKENTIRIPFDYIYRASPSGEMKFTGAESAVGAWNEEYLRQLEETFELASRYGIRILVQPFIASPPMWEYWSLNPYRGLAISPYAFLKSSDAREAYGRRLEGLTDRFGRTGSLLGWDLMNEANVLLDWGRISDPEAVATWTKEIGNRLARRERALHGRAHLRMLSWSSMTPIDQQGIRYASLFQSSGLDSASTHPYDVYGPDSWPPLFNRNEGNRWCGWHDEFCGGRGTWGSLVQPAVKLNRLLTAILTRHLVDRRPYLENERATYVSVMRSFAREGEHNISWAELASGAAGTGIRWLDTDPHLQSAGLEAAHLFSAGSSLALAAFVDAVPTEFFSSATTDEAYSTDLSSPDPEVVLMSVRRGHHAIGWILGLDERCGLAEGVQELRLAVNGGQHIRDDLVNGHWGLMLWMRLLDDAGIEFPSCDEDPRRFLRLIAHGGLPERNQALSMMPALYECFNNHPPSVGILDQYAVCPSLQPRLDAMMPAGNYALHWVDDTTGRVVGTDGFSANGTDPNRLRTPAFQKHLAVIVQPVPPSPRPPRRVAPRPAPARAALHAGT